MVFIKAHTNTEISVSVYFAMFIASLLVLDKTGLMPLALLCALLHEGGHFLVIRVLHIPVKEVSFRLFGAEIVLERETVLSYGHEIALSIAGSAANFITCMTALIFYNFNFLRNEAAAVFIFSLALGAFNLLPIGQLDGGRALAAFLCRRMQPDTARRVVDIVSAVLLAPLTAVAFLLIKQTGFNISLVLVCAYLIISLVWQTSSVPLKKRQ